MQAGTVPNSAMMHQILSVCTMGSALRPCVGHDQGVLKTTMGMYTIKDAVTLPRPSLKISTSTRRRIIHRKDGIVPLDLVDENSLQTTTGSPLPLQPPL